MSGGKAVFKVEWCDCCSKADGEVELFEHAALAVEMAQATVPSQRPDGSWGTEPMGDEPGRYVDVVVTLPGMRLTLPALRTDKALYRAVERLAERP